MATPNSTQYTLELRNSLPSETKMSPGWAPDSCPVNELGLTYDEDNGKPPGKPGKRASSPLYPLSIEDIELIESSELERRSKMDEAPEEEEGGAG